MQPSSLLMNSDLGGQHVQHWDLADGSQIPKYLKGSLLRTKRGTQLTLSRLSMSNIVLLINLLIFVVMIDYKDNFNFFTFLFSIILC